MMIYEKEFYNDISRIRKRITEPNGIDWEARRYEIVKEIVVGWLTHPDNDVSNEAGIKVELTIEGAISYADKMIEQLKKANKEKPL